ncbi:MAG TPA: hypothetical protein VMT30_05085 [Candidatus Saccharimonadia bacterium]|nr:hypothetical protein [Candidatus Saccharimonadia bacterium]
MKRFIASLSLLAAAAAVGLAPSPARAATPAEVKISGVVTEHGQPAAGVQVLGDCGHFAKYGQHLTGVDGAYQITFTVDQCPIGTRIRVFGFTSDYQKRAEGEAAAQPEVVIDMVLTSVISVPEYGWLGGILVGGTGLGALAYTRRRAQYSPRKAAPHA